MKFGIIGCGNMGGAILNAVAQKGMFAKEDIFPADKSTNIVEKLKTEGFIHAGACNCETAKADVLMLAVKPQMLRDLIDEIKNEIDYAKTIIISIAPGFTIEMLKQLLSADAMIVRAMPNTPAMIGEGMTAVCRSESVGETALKIAMDVFSACGSVEEIREGLIDAVVGVSGSAPAYVFMFIDALADAGVRYGMTKAQALRFAEQAVAGSALYAIRSGTHPAVLRDMVCSPAGTTIDAVATLEKNGLRSCVIEGASTAIEKSARMGGQKH